jgi:hypothetical protein
MSQGIVETIGGVALIAAGVLLPIPGVSQFLIAAGAGMVLGGVGTMLSQGPLQGFAIATRNPVAPWEVRYGQARAGGIYVFINSFGDNDKYLDLVLVLAAHPCQSVDTLLFDQQRIQMIPTGTGKTSASPVQENLVIADIARSGNVVTVKTVGDILALEDGDQVLIQQVPGDATLNGKFPVANVIHGGTYVQFTYLCGGPASHVVSAGHVLTTWVDYGNKVYMETMLGTQTLGSTFPGMIAGSPNDGNTGSLVHNTANPWTADCSLVGKTAVWLRLHYNDKIFANGLPQISFLLHGKNDIYDPRTSPPSYAYTENAALCIADHLSNPTWGFRAQYGTDIPLAPLIAAANVCDEAVDLAWPATSPAPTEPRYTTNGGFTLQMKRGDVLRNLLTSCAGRLTYFGGQYIIWPGAWYGVSGSITGSAILSMATAAFRWRSTVSMSNLYNGVKGTYIAPANNWQSSDFPRYAQDADHGYTWGVAPKYDANYDADGSERRWFDIQLPFTISASMAQRIAKIELLRRRNQGTGTFAVNMAGYQFTPMDVIAMDLAFFGWTGKTLEVLDARLKFDAQSSGGSSAMLLGVELDVQETDPSIYAWSIGEELSPQGYQQAIVPDTRTPGAPTNFFGSSADGNITLTWTAPSDAYVLNGGHIEVQYQRVASPEGLWISLAKMEPTITDAVIRGLHGGDQYNIRIRSVNAAGIPSDWVIAAPLLSSPPTPGPITVVAPLATALQLSWSGSQGQQNVQFAGALVAVGGVLPYAFSLLSGTLPPGLALNATTGAVNGKPTTAGQYSPTFEVTDDDGATAIVATYINIATPAGGSVLLGISSVTGRDIGHSTDETDEATRLVSFRVGCAVTFASAPLQYNTVFLSKDGGSNWIGINWYLWITSGQEINFLVPRPASAGTWKVAVAPGTVNFDPTTTIATASLPTGTILSATFSVAALDLPSATLGTSPTVGSGAGGSFPYNKLTPDGTQYWSIPSISIDLSSAFTDPNVFVINVTFQDLDSSHNPIGPEHIYGDVVAVNGTVNIGRLDGDYGTNGDSYTRTGNIAYVRAKFYASNRVDQTTSAFSNPAASTLQTDVGSGAGYLDILVAAGGASPAGKVLASRLKVGTADGTVEADTTTTGLNVYDGTGGITDPISRITPGQIDLLDPADGAPTSIIHNEAFLCAGKAHFNTGGRLDKYDNVTLAAKGIPHIVYAVSFVNQTATLFVTSLGASPLSGKFRVNVVVEANITAGSGTGSVSVSVNSSRTQGFGYVSASIVPVGTISWGGLSLSGCVAARTDGVLSTDTTTQGIGLSFSVGTAWTNGSFNVHVIVEKLDDY